MGNTAEAFWNNVAVGSPDECWLWTLGLWKDGYGQTRWDGHAIGAHRLAYTLAVGDPGELCVLHSCDNPPCCNPAHLFLGTKADNAADRNAKRRQSHGSRVPCSKLTEADVLALRAEHAAGSTHRALATKFGLSRGTVSKVIHRQSWSHI